MQRVAWLLLGFVLPLLLVGMAGASASLAPITGALNDISGDASQIKTAILTILGVLVTVGLAWAIVKGLQK